jgi:flavorubredoxin
MKKTISIYSQGEHKWIVVTRDPSRPEYLIDTNEYLIISGHEAILTDPGGSEIFASVFSALCEVTDPSNIKKLFASHQDPDIISSLSLWLDFNPEIKCYLSQLWTSFIPHYGGTDKTFIGLPDEGSKIQLGTLELIAFPAHYLHSSGNFHLYDPKANLLFSGDIGAAIGFEEGNEIFVKNFDRHIRHAEGFHRRWMGSEVAKLDWCERVSKLKIDMLCPQHGSIYTGKDVERFINWLSDLKIGTGIS